MITITVKDEQLQQALARLHSKLADMTPVMQQAGEDILLSVKRNFEEEGWPTPCLCVRTQTGKDGYSFPSLRATARSVAVWRLLRSCTLRKDRFFLAFIGVNWRFIVFGQIYFIHLPCLGENTHR